MSEKNESQNVEGYSLPYASTLFSKSVAAYA